MALWRLLRALIAVLAAFLRPRRRRVIGSGVAVSVPGQSSSRPGERETVQAERSPGPHSPRQAQGERRWPRESSSALVSARVWVSDELPPGVVWGEVSVRERGACAHCEGMRDLHLLPTPELRERYCPPFRQCVSPGGCSCLLSYEFEEQIAKWLGAEAVVAVVNLLSARGGTAPKFEIDAVLAPFRERAEARERARLHECAEQRARNEHFSIQRLEAGREERTNPARAEEIYRWLLASEDSSSWDVNRLSLLLERQKRYADALDVARAIERFPAAREEAQVRKRIARLEARIKRGA